MTISTTMLLIVLGCCLVTLIPRIAPFILVKKVKLPKWMTDWLSYIPICILTALIVQGMWTVEDGKLSLSWHYILALIPTSVAALWTRSLAVTVIVGVVSMALLRLWLTTIAA